MRVPKYRVFNTDEKHMYEVVSLEWSAASPDRFSRMALLSMDGLYRNRTVYGEETIHSNYELMEYIGLKDRNKKDVYVDDILSGQIYRYGYELGKVNWRKEYTGTVKWIQKDQIYGFYLVDKEGKYMPLLYATHRNEDFNGNGLLLEVIGNIWEIGGR